MLEGRGGCYRQKNSSRRSASVFFKTQRKNKLNFSCVENEKNMGGREMEKKCAGFDFQKENNTASSFVSLFLFYSPQKNVSFYLVAACLRFIVVAPPSFYLYPPYLCCARCYFIFFFPLFLIFFFGVLPLLFFIH